MFPLLSVGRKKKVTSCQHVWLCKDEMIISQECWQLYRQRNKFYKQTDTDTHTFKYTRERLWKVVCRRNGFTHTRMTVGAKGADIMLYRTNRLCSQQENKRITRWPPGVHPQEEWELGGRHNLLFVSYFQQIVLSMFNVLSACARSRECRNDSCFILQGLELKDRYEMLGTVVPHKGQP